MLEVRSKYKHHEKGIVRWTERVLTRDEERVGVKRQRRQVAKEVASQSYPKVSGERIESCLIEGGEDGAWTAVACLGVALVAEFAAPLLQDGLGRERGALDGKLSVNDIRASLE